MDAAPFDADVIIAGAGMAGATAALALASGGLKVIIIDPQPFDAQTAPTFDGRASAIAYSSFRQWLQIGAGEALVPHAQRIEQILVTDAQAPGAAKGRGMRSFLRFDSAEIADSSDGEPLGYMLENRHIRAAVGEAVLANANITVLAPERLEKVEVEPGRARVTLGNGKVITAPLVVGAEGRTSPVRQQSGIGVIGWDYPQVGVVATVAMEQDHEGVAHEYFLPAGPFAILPLTGKRASLVWTESRARGQALASARTEIVEAHLSRRFGEFLGTVRLDGPKFVYPLSLQLSERMCSPRIALLGDAAHAVHPIAGQGLNLGLKDAAALAEVLVDAVRLGEDIGSVAVLERYAAWRRFDNVALAAATDVFNRLFSNDHPLVRGVRGAGMAVINRIGPARRFFMQEAGGAVGDLPRLLRGLPL
jgi:2-octaprenyl-6-methoxyphenol hydroxylase